MNAPIKTTSLRLLSVVFMSLLISSCSDTSDDPVIPSKGDGKSRSIEITNAEKQASVQGNHFAWQLLEECMAENNDNVVLSPVSANICLSILANATGGNSQSQLLEALGYADMDIAAVNSLNRKLAQQISGLDDNVTVALANSLWYDVDIDPKPDFIRDLKDNYAIESYIINPPTFVDDVNAWCDKKTNGLIPRILEDGSLQAFAMMNALYFKGYWNGNYKFSKKNTKADVFYNADGSKSRVQYMCNQVNLGAYVTKDWSAMRIPFGGGGYNFTVILPSEGLTIDDCMESIKAFEPATGAFSDCKADIKLPKFNMSQQFDMIPVLRKLGVLDIFNEYYADLSNMTEQDVFVNTIMQKINFDINEDGAEAAAVTFVGGVYTTAVPEVYVVPFYVDRPFIFMISESSTGAILFMGRINKF